MDNRQLRALLKRHGACGEARDWLGNRDAATAWAECERGDWMLWFAVKAGVDRRVLVRAAAACAETALQFVPEGEDRPRLAIEAVRRWADDPTEANLEAVWIARRNAYAAAAYAAAAAAYAAAAAAYAADAAAYAAAYAAAAAAYAAADARSKSLKHCADLVRENIPFETFSL